MRDKLILRNWAKFKNRWRVNWRPRRLKLGLWGLGILLCSWLVINTLRLQVAATGSVDTFFVLGGSIRREIYAAELTKQHPETRVLVSQGSLDPCILLIFQREQAPVRRVWLEKCAKSTFDNFYFNIPLLDRWGVRKLKLITSPSHLPRAQWMAQILLGAHGIWIELDVVEEQGIPGNREHWLKTGLDVTRSVIWAVLSQFIQPKCSKLIPLTTVELHDWRDIGFKCEHQGKLKLD
ncbi:MAG: YdcF family protein [Microcoleus sp. SIO2G3]|nr:YdcF family protein [Microcoleus sp. SIO2G3]